MKDEGESRSYSLVESAPLSWATRGAPRAAAPRPFRTASGGRRRRRQPSGRRRRPAAEPKSAPPASPPLLSLSRVPASPLPLPPPPPALLPRRAVPRRRRSPGLDPASSSPDPCPPRPDLPSPTPVWPPPPLPPFAAAAPCWLGLGRLCAAARFSPSAAPRAASWGRLLGSRLAASGGGGGALPRRRPWGPWACGFRRRRPPVAWVAGGLWLRRRPWWSVGRLVPPLWGLVAGSAWHGGFCSG